MKSVSYGARGMIRRYLNEICGYFTRLNFRLLNSQLLMSSNCVPHHLPWMLSYSTFDKWEQSGPCRFLLCCILMAGAYVFGKAILWIKYQISAQHLHPICENLNSEELTNEEKEALAAQYATETTLTRVYATQKDDDSVPIELVVAPELKMHKNERRRNGAEAVAAPLGKAWQVVGGEGCCLAAAEVAAHEEVSKLGLVYFVIVRVIAVSTLAKFGATIDSLKIAMRTKSMDQSPLIEITSEGLIRFFSMGTTFRFTKFNMFTTISSTKSPNFSNKLTKFQSAISSTNFLNEFTKFQQHFSTLSQKIKYLTGPGMDPRMDGDGETGNVIQTQKIAGAREVRDRRIFSHFKLGDEEVKAEHGLVDTKEKNGQTYIGCFSLETKYILDLLTRTHMQDSKTCPTPLASGLKLFAYDGATLDDATDVVKNRIIFILSNTSRLLTNSKHGVAIDNLGARLSIYDFPLSIIIRVARLRFLGAQDSNTTVVSAANGLMSTRIHS
ncbi:microtubule-associated protein 70-2 [Striga asiatica]|uniref:Microtubule-associated protein 70-2 n=1 Tax=Striga asiatica TaxID=4170 RepID=A0A5A7P9L8_STRAF|nr:microtubule-associated protein 70-2 [Striga asiatica]